MKPIEIFDKMAAMGVTLEQAVQFTDNLVSREYASVKQANTPATQAAFQLISQLAQGGASAGQFLLKGADTAVNAAKAVAPYALLATVGPGYLAGHQLASAMDADSGDVADIQEQELLDEINTNIEQLRKRR